MVNFKLIAFQETIKQSDSVHITMTPEEMDELSVMMGNDVYSEDYTKPLPGDIIFVFNGSKGLVSLGVAMLGSPIKFMKYGINKIPTHVAMYVGGWKIHEAHFPGGYEEKSLNVYKKFEVGRIKDITPEQREIIIQLSNESLGVPYDTAGAMGTVLSRLLQKVGMSNFMDDPINMFCSEALPKWARIAGKPLYPNEEDDSYSLPVHLYEIETIIKLFKIKRFQYKQEEGET